MRLSAATPAASTADTFLSEWFDRVGYTVDRAALRREFPEVAFHDFESCAKTQNWNTLLYGA